jgi:hypothetical protein
MDAFDELYRRYGVVSLRLPSANSSAIAVKRKTSSTKHFSRSFAIAVKASSEVSAPGSSKSPETYA